MPFGIPINPILFWNLNLMQETYYAATKESEKLVPLEEKSRISRQVEKGFLSILLTAGFHRFRWRIEKCPWYRITVGGKKTKLPALTEIGFKTTNKKKEDCGEPSFSASSWSWCWAAGWILFKLALAEEGGGVAAADRAGSVCLEREIKIRKPLVKRVWLSTVRSRSCSLHCLCFQFNYTAFARERCSLDFSSGICFNGRGDQISLFVFKWAVSFLWGLERGGEF